MTHEIEDVFTRIFDEKQIDTNRLKEITPLINKECLNISGEDEFYHIIQIITSVTFRNLVEKYSRNMSKEEALENFIIEMNLLKRVYTSNLPYTTRNTCTENYRKWGMINDSYNLWSCMFVDKESKAMVFKARDSLQGKKCDKGSAHCS